jgi:hypothetical protein
MERWIVKALVQNGLSLLPYRDFWNYQFQRHFTKRILPTKGKLARRFRWAAEHLQNYDRQRGQLPHTVLELGTGWLPTVPLALGLSGVKTTITVDIHDLRRSDLLRLWLDTARSFSFDELVELLPKINKDCYTALRTAADADMLLKALGVQFLVGDIRHLSLPDRSVDFIISNTTLEHIDRKTLTGIFHSFGRLIAKDGLMSHLIDMSDHFSHGDPSVGAYNFLQYSEAQFRIINNTLLYQNRLRASDYRQMLTESGFETVFEKSGARHTTELLAVQLAPEFQHYSIDDLAITTSWIVSQSSP